MVTMRLVTKADESRQTKKKTVVASRMVIMVLILTRITTNNTLPEMLPLC